MTSLGGDHGPRGTQKAGGNVPISSSQPSPSPSPSFRPSPNVYFWIWGSLRPGAGFRGYAFRKGLQNLAKPPSESKPWEGLGAIVEEGSTKRVLCDSIEDGGAAGKARRIPDTLDAWAARRGETSTLSTPGPARRRESPILSTIGFERCRYFQHFGAKSARIHDTFDASAGKARRILDTLDA